MLRLSSSRQGPLSFFRLLIFTLHPNQLSALDWGSSGSGWCVGWGHCVVIYFGNLSTSQYLWATSQCQVNLRECAEVSYNGLAPHLMEMKTLARKPK